MNAAISLPLNQSAEVLLPAAYSLLHRLGVTENYKGFRYAAYAAALCALEEERLLLVTKLLYPDVARRFGTTWKAVERNLRTVSDIAWTQNRDYLAYLSQSPLVQKPQCAQFLSILALALRPSKAANSKDNP